MSDGAEGREGAKRVEAFSDGVIAIIITIMVLEMHAPEEEGLGHLWALWPVFTAYALSYAYVAIYWVNHHRMFHHATHVTSGLLWANIALLGWRFAARALFVWRSYGGREAWWSAPRMFVGNFIALLAARRALTLYVEMLAGAPPRWDKTDHQFPADVARATA